MRKPRARPSSAPPAASLRFARAIAYATAVLALCAFAGGCGRGGDGSALPSPPAAGADPQGQAQAGRITVSGDDAIAASLTWQRPPLTLSEAELPAARRRAAAALAQGRLYETADAAIPLYLAILERNALDREAERGLQRAFARLIAAGDAALAVADDDPVALQRARQVAAVVRSVGAVRDPDATLAYLGRVDRAERLWELNTQGERALAQERLGDDEDRDGAGALALFRQALALAPGQPRAMQGLAAVESGLLRRAEEAALEGDFDVAEQWLRQAAQVRPEFTQSLETGRQRVEAIRRVRIAQLQGEGLAYLVEPNRPNHLKNARGKLAEILRIAAPGDPVAAELRQRIDVAAHYGLMRPGQRFTDALDRGGRGPQMVVVPHGGFRMGAPPGEREADDAERPLRYVRFDRGFAMSRTEITVGQFRRFIESSGYRPRAMRRGHSLVYDDRGGNFVLRSGVDWRHDYLGRPATDDLPVLHVSAKDAEAYAQWLSERTGQRYRLPSEAEFEYAVRAGSSGRYAWGEGTPPPDMGNFTGAGDRSEAGRRWGNAFRGYTDGYWGPAPVASFRANAFGLHDVDGNVSEWVADCWHDGYRRAPTNGEAWLNPGCRVRVIRGGAWSSAPAQTRSAWRIYAENNVTNARTGFRVVREL